MGFLDKAKEQAEKLAKQGQEKLEEVQSKKKADGLLRDLGAWYYASHTGRDQGKGQGQIDRIVGELQAHEAEFGPLGSADDQATTPPGPGPQPHAVPQSPAPAGVVPPPPPPPPSGEVPPPPVVSAPPPPPMPSGAPSTPPVVPTPPAPPAPPVADGGTALDDL